MSKRHSFLMGAALALSMALPLAAEEVTGKTVVATVNGDEITLAHMVAARAALPEQYQSLPDDVLFEGLLDQLIQQTVLGQAMGELSRRTEIQLENERRALIASEMLQGVVDEAVTEEALQTAYDETYAAAEPTKEWNASHILVATEDEAKALVEELTGGADFAGLAKEKSTGPSGPNGGELGWFSAGMMVKPFEDTVMTLEDGEVSAPVQTQFGWHVVKLNESRMQGAPALDEVREDLVAQIQNSAAEQAIATLMEDAKVTRADLEGVDPATLQDLTLID
ncbi:peptidylprolyl isomerase [Aliiroseovarius subalbicans]|uniref:peptidylprolyl isomerase n=1 Tax=Aliiroseovarius subalbicans TaxID=2925840 RepID=UPI001F58F58E|nr:peptidylprolyl isomerase [Aliiroseovarius subalbicans]MCI2400099.1 peptidylprolyl isomerase [Aliiroseovarius subalbicans]